MSGRFENGEKEKTAGSWRCRAGVPQTKREENKMQKYFITRQRKTKGQKSPLTGALLAVLIGLIIFSIYTLAARAESEEITCWILSKTNVNARRTPDGRGEIVGSLDPGDEFRTDGVCKNGYVRALGIGEYGEAWIYSGYVVTDRVEKSGENHVCVAKNRVACRKWCDGPMIGGRGGWLKNGSCVQVFWKSAEWCVTNRGYIKTEWLEVDPV